MSKRSLTRRPVALVGATSMSQRVERALRMRRRGQERQAMLALRDACAHDEYCAKTWALYGAQCARLGKTQAAHQALSHALWLRLRARQLRRAEVLRRLSDCLDARTRWVA